MKTVRGFPEHSKNVAEMIALFFAIIAVIFSVYGLSQLYRDVVMTTYSLVTVFLFVIMLIFYNPIKKPNEKFISFIVTTLSFVSIIYVLIFTKEVDVFGLSYVQMLTVFTVFFVICLILYFENVKVYHVMSALLLVISVFMTASLYQRTSEFTKEKNVLWCKKTGEIIQKDYIFIPVCFKDFGDVISIVDVPYPIALKVKVKALVNLDSTKVNSFSKTSLGFNKVTKIFLYPSTVDVYDKIKERVSDTCFVDFGTISVSEDTKKPGINQILSNKIKEKIQEIFGFSERDLKIFKIESLIGV